MGNTVRWQIDFNKDKVKDLEALMREGRVGTKKDFINAALTLLQWAMKEKRAGRVIASVDEARDSYKELEMPVLSEVKPVAKER